MVSSELTINLLVTLGGLCVSTATMAVAGSWKLRDAMAAQAASLMEQFANEARRITGKFDNHQKYDDEQFERVRKEVGEGLSAIRAKMTEVELFTRDTFVRRDSFHAAIDELKSDARDARTDMKEALVKIDAHLLRIEEKVTGK